MYINIYIITKTVGLRYNFCCDLEGICWHLSQWLYNYHLTSTLCRTTYTWISLFLAWIKN